MSNPTDVPSQLFFKCDSRLKLQNQKAGGFDSVLGEGLHKGSTKEMISSEIRHDLLIK